MKFTLKDIGIQNIRIILSLHKFNYVNLGFLFSLVKTLIKFNKSAKKPISNAKNVVQLNKGLLPL